MWRGHRNNYRAVVSCVACLAVLMSTGGGRASAQSIFKANGGDVVAGSSIATDMATSCGVAPIVSTAGIVSWNADGSPNYAGAGGQYAAYALSYIQDFVTGQGNSQVPIGQETNQLTFANVNISGSVNTTAGLFGGMLGNAPCADFWNAHPAAATPPPGGAIGGWGSGTYYTTSNINLSGTLGVGQHVTLYVNGDVAITGNITYNTSGWNSRGDIPSFRLIVHGVTYIDHAVTQLDGLYAAIPTTGETTKKNNYASPNDGTISTCSRLSGGVYTSFDPSLILSSSSTMLADCGQQLVVNGSFVAQQVWLLRNFGNVGGAPAELFNYDPEIWLVQAGTAAGLGSTGYQSIVGLPPTL